MATTKLQQYTTGSFYVNGTLLSEATSVTITRNTNANKVYTIAKGFSGLSLGNREIEGSVENVVPSADFELDVGDFMASLETVKFDIFVGGRTMTIEGFILQDTIHFSAGATSGLSFSFVAPFGNFEALGV
jgi:hypothetical protein